MHKAVTQVHRGGSHEGAASQVEAVVAVHLGVRNRRIADFEAELPGTHETSRSSEPT